MSTQNTTFRYTCTDHNLDIDTTIGQPHATAVMAGTDIVGPDHNPIITDTAAPVNIIPTGAIPGHTKGTTEDIRGVVHNAHTQTLIHIVLTVTLHTADHLYTGAHQLPQEIAADHTLDQPTGQLRKPHTNLHQNPEDHKVK